MLPIKKSLIALAVSGLISFPVFGKDFSVGDRMPDFGEIPDRISFIDSDGDKIIDYTVLPHKCNDKKKLFGFYDFRTNKLHLSENFDGRISSIFPYDGKVKLSDYIPVCS